MSFPYVEVSGSPYDAGFQHGRALRAEIENSVACYRAMFYDYSGLEWSRVRELAAVFAPMIESYEPRYLDEIRGIADGSGFAFEDILALNCRSELVFVGAEMDEVEGGCTTIGVSSRRSRSGETLMGYNWDWKAAQGAGMALLRISGAGERPDILMLTEAGIIGKAGINSAGLCLTLNALSTDEPPKGLPLHIAMRGILECETIYEAIRAAGRMPLGCCANFMIGSANGELVDIEVENGDFEVMYPDEGWIVHTNHFIHPRYPREPRKDTMKLKVPDTFVRLGRARTLVESAFGVSGLVGEDDLMSILKDHVEFPSSICRHEDPKMAEGLRMGTVFSMVANLPKRELLVCAGNPCEGVYESYRL